VLVDVFSLTYQVHSKKCNSIDSERRHKDLFTCLGYKVNMGLKYMSICLKTNNLRAESEDLLKNFRAVLRQIFY